MSLLRRGWLVTTVTGIACALTLIGCGSDDDLDACGLLSNDEAAELLGVPVHDGEADTDRTIEATFCRWVARGSDTRESADETYQLWIDEGSDTRTLKHFDEARTSDDAESIADLGDVAFIYRPDRYTTELKMRIDDRAVTIGADSDRQHRLSEQEEQALLRRAADQVQERLS